MSQVKLSQRKTSYMQYVDTAREIVVHTIKYCRKFPKSAMFLITKDIVDTARELYKETIKASSSKDVDFKYRHLLEARANLDALDALLTLAKDIFDNDVSEYGWLHWGDLILKERDLIDKAGCISRRCPNSGNSNNFCNVNSDGNANNNNASNSNGTSP